MAPDDTMTLTSTCCNELVELVDSWEYQTKTYMGREITVHWEEEYKCLNCGKTGTLEVDESQDPPYQTKTGILADE